MRTVLGFYSLFLFAAPLFAATSQTPCQNALYYARDVTHHDEILICHTSSQRYALLYGPVLNTQPYIDTTLPDTQLQVIHAAPGRCQLTFIASDYRWVLNTQDRTAAIPAPDTVDIYRDGQFQQTVTLSHTITLRFIQELRQVREICE